MGGKLGGTKPTDRGTLGPKRRVLPDGGGVPLGRAVEGAKRTDGKRGAATLTRLPIERPPPPPAPPPGMGWDPGADDDEGRELLAECGVTAHLRARGEEAKTLTQEAGFKARRWVVVRTQSGRNRFRRVLIRWDKNVGPSLARCCRWRVPP